MSPLAQLTESLAINHLTVSADVAPQRARTGQATARFASTQLEHFDVVAGALADLGAP